MCSSMRLYSFAHSVPIARIIAKKLNILDIPDGKIKQHTVATPYLGGVAVYLGTLIPSLFFSFIIVQLYMFIFAWLYHIAHRWIN